MNTFIRFFYEFFSIFFEGVTTLLKGFINGIKQMFNINNYIKILNNYKESFEGPEWLFVVISIVILVIIIGLIVFLIYLYVKKVVRRKNSKLNQDSLLNEIANLDDQVKKLMKEKDEVMAMKVSQLGLSPNEDNKEEVKDNKTPDNGEKPDEKGNPLIRFPQLDNIDKECQGKKIENYNNNFTLKEMIENFRCFSASKLHLYYDFNLLRPFIAGLACGKLIILQGISGTGKTSLAYAWGKFVNNDSCVASVQPSWRDKSDFLGYFNEFTKKFNETKTLSELYLAGYDDNVHTIILDEMNIARVEYYFAEFLSILEMPSREEWIIELVPSGWPMDPKKLLFGKLKLSGNLWFIGTINNDDSTFMVTDKVYDRAMPIDINTKVEPFECREQEAIDINSTYMESLFKEAIETIPISKENFAKIDELDKYVTTHFRVAFGNRIMKQLKIFVSVYVACGGEEVAAIDYFIAKKILRKFEQLNIAFILDEIDPFISYLDKQFGKNAMIECIEYAKRLKKSV